MGKAANAAQALLGVGGAARKQKWSSLLAPFWVVKQGVGRRLCPYTWYPETPLAAARPEPGPGYHLVAEQAQN